MLISEVLNEAQLIAKPIDGIDPLSRKPVTNWQIMDGDMVLTIVAGRFAKTPEEAIANYQRRTLIPMNARVAEPQPAKPKMPRVITSNFQLVDANDIHDTDAPDEFYYHVTARPKTVLRHGLKPNQRASMDDGFYRTYSAGKVFFCDRPAVCYWLERINAHLAQQYDNPPKLYVMRFLKDLVKHAEIDKLGSDDSRSGSYFSTKPIR